MLIKEVLESTTEQRSFGFYLDGRYIGNWTKAVETKDSLIIEASHADGMNLTHIIRHADPNKELKVSFRKKLYDVKYIRNDDIYF